MRPTSTAGVGRPWLAVLILNLLPMQPPEGQSLFGRGPLVLGRGASSSGLRDSWSEPIRLEPGFAPLDSLPIPRVVRADAVADVLEARIAISGHKCTPS